MKLNNIKTFNNRIICMNFSNDLLFQKRKYNI